MFTKMDDTNDFQTFMADANNLAVEGRKKLATFWARRAWLLGQSNTDAARLRFSEKFDASRLADLLWRERTVPGTFERTVETEFTNFLKGSK